MEFIFPTLDREGRVVPRHSITTDNSSNAPQNDKATSDPREYGEQVSDISTILKNEAKTLDRREEAMAEREKDMMEREDAMAKREANILSRQGDLEERLEGQEVLVNRLTKLTTEAKPIEEKKPVLYIYLGPGKNRKQDQEAWAKVVAENEMFSNSQKAKDDFASDLAANGALNIPDSPPHSPCFSPPSPEYHSTRAEYAPSPPPGTTSPCFSPPSPPYHFAYHGSNDSSLGTTRPIFDDHKNVEHKTFRPRSLKSRPSVFSYPVSSLTTAKPTNFKTDVEKGSIVLAEKDKEIKDDKQASIAYRQKMFAAKTLTALANNTKEIKSNKDADMQTRTAFLAAKEQMEKTAKAEKQERSMWQE